MRSRATRDAHWVRGKARSRNESVPATTVSWLIDNCEAYSALVTAVRGARQSIWISQLAFDADCIVHNTDGLDGERLLNVILDVSSRHAVPVQILVNSTLLLDTRRPLVRALAAETARAALVEVRGISRFPQLLHAKVVIIDGKHAFVVGSPFVNGYWDAPTHDPVDARRPHRELGGRPVHDVSFCLRGEAVANLVALFSRWWSDVAVADISVHRERNKASRQIAAAVQSNITVVSTEPAGTRKSRSNGSTSLLDTLLHGINRARSLIYIEHQYLSSRPVAAALRNALDRESGLEIVMLLNQNPDVTAYRRWQNARLEETELFAHPRVGVFALWTIAASAKSERRIVNQVFVHSKVAIIDDYWALAGSANLDGASLKSYGDDFTGRLARRVFRDVRNFDIGIVLGEHSDAIHSSHEVRTLRERLWTEHLGDTAVPFAGNASALAEWNHVAARNVAALRTDQIESTLQGSFILPYCFQPTPRAQLDSLGVTLSNSLELAFNPGWIETNFSPNWVRNMFL